MGYGATYDSGLDDGDPILRYNPNDYRPLPTGTKLIYYDDQRKMNIAAEVKASTVSFLWIVDEEDRHQSFIMYMDIGCHTQSSENTAPPIVIRRPLPS